MTLLDAPAADDLRPVADPANFRTTYRKQRWYIDPLPACDLAEASPERWPAMSTIKRAWNQTFRKRWDDGNTYDLDPLRVAIYADANWSDLTPLPTDQRVPRLALAAKADLDIASARGTAVHNALDLLLAGNEKAAAETCHPDYWQTIRRMVTTEGIELVHAERVAISRTHGWGGTFDGILSIADRGLYLVDWKTRGADSNHGAYEAEGAQLGGYALADYIIIEGDDGLAHRAALPELAGAVVVSIKPDGWEIYPVDLEAAKAAAIDMRAAWATIATGKAHGRKAIGKPWASAAPEPSRTDWIVQRITALKANHPEVVDALRVAWPHDVPRKPPWEDAQIDLIDRALNMVEPSWPSNDPAVVAERKAQAEHTPPAVEEPPALWDVEDDGTLATDEDATALRSTIAALPEDQLATIRAWVRDANAQQRPWTDGNDMTTRGWAIGRCAIRAIKAWHADGRANTRLRAVLAYVLVEDLHPTWTTGAVLGSLTLAQAEQAADVIAAYQARDKTVKTVIDGITDAA